MLIIRNLKEKFSFVFHIRGIHRFSFFRLVHAQVLLGQEIHKYHRKLHTSFYFPKCKAYVNSANDIARCLNHKSDVWVSIKVFIILCFTYMRLIVHTYKNQWTDLHCKCVDWFLCKSNIGLISVKLLIKSK